MFVKRFKIGQVPVYTGKQGRYDCEDPKQRKMLLCLFPILVMPTQATSLCGQPWKGTKEKLKSDYRWVFAHSKEYCPECLAVLGIVPD